MTSSEAAALFFWLLLCGGIGALRIRRRWIGLTARKFSLLSRPGPSGEDELCHACGYNLKGVESYRCPECGIVRLYSARQWKAKVAADAAKLAKLKQKEQESV